MRDLTIQINSAKKIYNNSVAEKNRELKKKIEKIKNKKIDMIDKF